MASLYSPPIARDLQAEDMFEEEGDDAMPEFEVEDQSPDEGERSSGAWNLNLGILRREPKGKGKKPLPLYISPDVLLGCMPKPEKALKVGILGRLTSKYDWKDMRVILTEEALHFSNPDEDILRDMIPLLEVIKVRKAKHPMNSADSSSMLVMCAAPTTDAPNGASNGDRAPTTTVLQIQTADGGYNSGRSYYLCAGSAAEQDEWHAAIGAACGACARRAAPSAGRAAQASLRAVYNSRPFQVRAEKDAEATSVARTCELASRAV